MLVVAIALAKRLIVSALGKDHKIANINLALAAAVPETVKERRLAERGDRIPIALIETAEADEVNCPHRYTPHLLRTLRISDGLYPAASALA